MNIYIDLKPTLEWVEDNDRYYCKQGEYHISLIKNGLWFLESNHRRDILSYYETPDQAKAAAQADYEARTAERFRAVELPDRITLPDEVRDYDYFYLRMGRYHTLNEIHETIAKAKEQP
jgi:hypothetical protein